MVVVDKGRPQSRSVFFVFDPNHELAGATVESTLFNDGLFCFSLRVIAIPCGMNKLRDGYHPNGKVTHG